MSYNKLSTSIKNLIQSVRNSERGQSTLEFGFAAIVLLMLTLGVIDFGRAVYAKSVVEAASQEGARMGIVNINQGHVDMATTKAAVRARMFALDADSAEIDVLQSGDDVVEVTVTYDFRFVTPFMVSLFPGDEFELVGTSSMLRQ